MNREGRRRQAAWAMAAGALWAAAAAGIAGCGYHFEGGSSALPPDIRTIAIPMFVNDTDVDGIETSFTSALIDAFGRGHQVRVIDSPETADAIIAGRIVRLHNEAVSFSTEDDVLEFEITAFVAVKLKRRVDGQILWQDPQVRAKEEFGVTADSVVTSSPDFQGRESTFNDPRFLSTIEVTETEQREAVDRLSRTFAKTVYLRIMQDF